MFWVIFISGVVFIFELIFIFEIVFIFGAVFLFEVILICRNLNFFRSSWFWGQDDIQFCLNSLSCFHILVISKIYECGTAQTSYQNMSAALLRHLEKYWKYTVTNPQIHTHTQKLSYRSSANFVCAGKKYSYEYSFKNLSSSSKHSYRFK